MVEVAGCSKASASDIRRYRTACEQADLLLFAAGDLQAREAAFKECPVGKLTAEAPYLHVGVIGRVPSVVRIYEGCGRALTGTVTDANLIKLHRLKAQVSNLSYPEFDRDPHPRLATVVVSRLHRLDVTYRDFRDSSNPPILHRNETFVHAGRGSAGESHRLSSGVLLHPVVVPTKWADLRNHTPKATRCLVMRLCWRSAPLRRPRRFIIRVLPRPGDRTS